MMHTKRTSDPSEGKLDWLSPFGDALDGSMLGTTALPALHLPLDSEILPKQSTEDNYNCGYGVIATIVLRDMVLNDDWTNSSNSRSTFDDRFSCSALELKICATNGDVFCDMNHRKFCPLSSLPKFRRDIYLLQLREQWFVVLDRLAKFQYDTEPQKLFADYHTPDASTSTLGQLEFKICCRNQRHQLPHLLRFGERHNVRFCQRRRWTKPML